MMLTSTGKAITLAKWNPIICERIITSGQQDKTNNRSSWSKTIETNRMYKYKAEAEQDSSGYEWVGKNARCEDCGKKYKNCECGDVIEDDDEDAPFDELDYRR